MTQFKFLLFMVLKNIYLLEKKKLINLEKYKKGKHFHKFLSTT